MHKTFDFASIFWSQYVLYTVILVTSD